MGGQARTSYPLLPWIGVAAWGYALGPGFKAEPTARRLRLLAIGLGMLASFVVPRVINVYGDAPWSSQPTAIQTAMSVLNLTEYPPSADFLLLTGIGAVLLAAWNARLDAFCGCCPSTAERRFSSTCHLYALHLLHLAALALFGANQGEESGVGGVIWVWALAAAVALPSWFACRWFAGVKRRSDQPWMKHL